MKTVHEIFFKNAGSMEDIPNKSVDLMITSPPYPMIEMWDKIFSKQNPVIGEALENKDGVTAFELMNKELDIVWKEVYRVLKDGGIACINIGDATRKIGDEFRLYSNHSRIIEKPEKSLLGLCRSDAKEKEKWLTIGNCRNSF